MPLADRTTLNNVTPNLDIGDVADPALRLAFFNYVVSLMDANYNEFKAFQTGVGTVIDGGFFTDSPTDTVDGGTFL